MKTMLDSLRLVTALHPRVDYCLLVDTIQVPASRHRDLPGHFPKKCIKSPRYLSTINFKNPIFIAPSFTEPSLLNPTNQQLQTPSIHPPSPPLLAVWPVPSRPCWPLPPWPAVVPKLRGPRSWLGQWHCSGCPCRRSGFLEV